MKLNLLITLVFVSIQVTGQQLVSTSGGYYTNSNGSLSWSLGEPVINTLAASNSILTQGFQQYVRTGTAVPTIAGKGTFEVYPNPSSIYINIDLNNDQVLKYQFRLYDMNGRIVKDESPNTSNYYRMNIDGIPSGVYLLEIISDTGINSFKIIKN